MNLSEKVPIGPPVEVAGAGTGEEELPLPEWSEKMSQGILAGRGVCVCVGVYVFEHAVCLYIPPSLQVHRG